MLDHTDPVASIIPASSLDVPSDNAMTALSRLALGPVNTDYYLAVFERFDSTGRTTTTWNAAASLATLNWMVFRQLWGAALVYVAAAEGLALALLAMGRTWLHWPLGVEVGVLGAVAMLAFAVPGLYGNAILYADIRKRVARALAASRTLPEACALLQKQASTRRRLHALVGVNVALVATAALAYALWPTSPSSSASEAPARPLSLERSVTVAQATAAAAASATASTPASATASAPAASASGPVRSGQAIAPQESRGTVSTLPSADNSADTSAGASVKASAGPSAPASAATPRTNVPASAPQQPSSAGPMAKTPAVAPATRTQAEPPVSAAPGPQPKASAAAPAAKPPPTSPPASAPLAPIAKTATPPASVPARREGAAGRTTATPAAKSSAPVAAPPASADAVAAGAQPVVGTAAGYYINVGLFADEANARKAQARLLNEGLPAFRQELNGAKGRRIRVRVGPYDSRAQADAAAASIRSMSLEAVVFKQ